MSQLPLWSQTSLEAAKSIEPCAETLRSMALYHITMKAATADEVANVLRVSVLSIRPRIAELKKMGLIEDTGYRRHNESGRAATVWKRK